MTATAPHATDRRAALRQILSLLPALQRRRAGWLVLLTLAGGAAEMVTIGAVVPLLTLLTRGQEVQLPAMLQAITPTVSQAAALFIVAAVAAGLLRLWLSWSTQQMAVETGHWVASEIHRRVLLQPYGYHLQVHSSTLIASLSKVQDLVWGVLLPGLQGISAAIMALLIFVLLLWLNAPAALGAALLFAVLYAIVWVGLRRPLYRTSRVVSSAYDQRIRLVQDSLGGIRDILLDGSQQAHGESFRAADKRFASASAQLGFLSAAPRFLIETAALVAIVLLALLLARNGGLLPILPLLGALALGAQRLLPLLQQLYHSWSAVAGHQAVIEDIAALLSLSDEGADGSAVTALPFHSHIQLEGVRFTYPERAVPALDKIDLTIRKGSRVALSGRTGSGKSTLADLIMGLVPPEQGSIRVDGVDLVESNRAGWRRNIAHVPQAVFLSDASLRENIAFGVPPTQIDEARLAEAVRTAQLEAFVRELPKGLGTRVGERGVQLSGGQRQRLALARAIYRAKPVLVLDEATSALDLETEAAVLDALDILQGQGVTILVIAHREAALRGCDSIVWLEGGRIVPESQAAAAETLSP